VTHTSVERNPVHCFSTVLSLCNSLALARSYRGRSLHQSLLRRVRYSFCIHQLLQQPLVQRRKRTPNLSLPLYLSLCLSVCLSASLSVCLSASLPLCLSIYLSVCPSVQVLHTEREQHSSQQRSKSSQRTSPLRSSLRRVLRRGRRLSCSDVCRNRFVPRTL
jgi:hypothetical protein